MDTLVKLAPILNTMIILCGGLVLLMRLNDSLKSFQKTLDRMLSEMGVIKQRVMQLETLHCAYHPGEVRDVGQGPI